MFEWVGDYICEYDLTRLLYPGTQAVHVLHETFPSHCNWWGTRGLFPHGSFSESMAGFTEQNDRKKWDKFWYNCYTEMKHDVFRRSFWLEDSHEGDDL